MTPTATIEVPPPPSVNVTRGEHWSTTHRRRRALVNDMGMLLLEAKVPRPIPGDRVHATAVARFPVSRRRDEGNLRAPLEKALGDTLAGGGWISDDTPDQFTFGELVFEHAPGLPARVAITLGWRDG